jgi:hypothetical protein
MQTDDEITTLLRSAFSDATEGLDYRGTVPFERRRVAPIALRAAIPVGAAAALVVGIGLHSSPSITPPGIADPSTGAKPSHAVTPKVRLVTDRYQIGAHTLTITRDAGTAAIFQDNCDPTSAPSTPQADLDCYIAVETLVKEGPSDETPVDIPGLPGAAIGIDPQSGEAALFIVNADGTKVFELLSPDKTKQQLIDLAKTMSAH